MQTWWSERWWWRLQNPGHRQAHEDTHLAYSAVNLTWLSCEMDWMWAQLCEPSHFHQTAKLWKKITQSARSLDLTTNFKYCIVKPWYTKLCHWKKTLALSCGTTLYILCCCCPCKQQLQGEETGLANTSLWHPHIRFLNWDLQPYMYQEHPHLQSWLPFLFVISILLPWCCYSI